jgi:hypothetical protein
MTPSRVKDVSRYDQSGLLPQTPPPGRVPHVCTGVAGALHGLKRRGEAPSYVFVMTGATDE